RGVSDRARSLYRARSEGAPVNDRAASGAQSAERRARRRASDLELTRAPDPSAVELEPAGRAERLDAVDDRGAEVDRRRVVEVARARGLLGDPEAEVRGLHEDLGIECEVERVPEEGHGQQE